MHGPTTLTLLQAPGLLPGAEVQGLIYPSSLSWPMPRLGIFHLPAPTRLFTSSHHPKTKNPRHCTFPAAALWQLGQSWGVLQHPSLDKAAGPQVQPALLARSGHNGSSVCRCSACILRAEDGFIHQDINSCTLLLLKVYSTARVTAIFTLKEYALLVSFL